MLPVKTQICLDICSVWSESLLYAQQVAKDPSFLLLKLDWADAQADPSLCWVYMPFCWFCHVLAHLPFHSCALFSNIYPKIQWNVCCFSSTGFELLMFHNNIVKISEILTKWNLLKICLQSNYPINFCTILSHFHNRKKCCFFCCFFFFQFF